MQEFEGHESTAVELGEKRRYACILPEKVREGPTFLLGIGGGIGGIEAICLNNARESESLSERVQLFILLRIGQGQGQGGRGGGDMHAYCQRT